MTATIHILVVPENEVRRETDGNPRWCFGCRKRTVFERVVSVPVCETPDDTGCWYPPRTYIECTGCKLIDGDLFPGRWREWEE